MRFRTVLLIIVVVATAAFLVINWRVFAAPVHLNFLFGTAEIPIGTVMLGLLALVILAFAIYVGIWQGTILMDYRRQSKELQTQRTLADDAEASRFTELSTLLRDEMSKLDKRLEAALDALRGEVRDTEHSIAATLGEMDDKIQRATNRNTD
jgi:uncharacterized integral membrane protein